LLVAIRSQGLSGMSHGLSWRRSWAWASRPWIAWSLTGCRRWRGGGVPAVSGLLQRSPGHRSGGRRHERHEAPIGTLASTGARSYACIRQLHPGSGV